MHRRRTRFAPKSHRLLCREEALPRAARVDKHLLPGPACRRVLLYLRWYLVRAGRAAAHTASLCEVHVQARHARSCCDDDRWVGQSVRYLCERLRRWQFSERCQCRGLLGCRRAKAYQNATHNDGEDEDSTKGARQADASARVLGVAVVQPTARARRRPDWQPAVGPSYIRVGARFCSCAARRPRHFVTMVEPTE